MPVHFEEVTVPEKKFVGFTCNKCKQTFSCDNPDHTWEIEEYFYGGRTCGYNSVFGDEMKIELTLCQHCFKDVCGEYVEVQPI